jgi:hypothetical protein
MGALPHREPFSEHQAKAKQTMPEIRDWKWKG